MAEDRYPGEKTGQVRKIRVRAHDRYIALRRFKFVCAYCHNPVTRETYSPVCPKYGNVCGGKMAECRRSAKKQ